MTTVAPAGSTLLANLGLDSRASGVSADGRDAEMVLVFGGHPTAPLCQSDPEPCTAAGMAAETSQQDPGTRAATFRKDGLPLDSGQS